MTLCGNSLSRSLLGVKRTCLLRCICPLLTHSGHRASLNVALLNRYDACLKPRGQQLRRREFIGLVGSAAAAWPLVARGQQSVTPTVGILDNASLSQYTPAFHQGLKEAGYIEGQNVVIERHSAEGQYDR